MKSFQNKKALTLIELIISVAISSVLILIVSFLITSSVEELSSSIVRTESIDVGFSFKDKLNRYIRGGYNDLYLYGDGGNKNNTLLLKNDSGDKGVLFGVVNNDTKKIQRDYIYGENYIGYRLMSSTELNDIVTNSGVIYDYSFHGDKIFSGMRVKDFKGEIYNGGELLDINISVINRRDDYGFGENMEDILIDRKDIFEFYLVF